MKCAVCKQELTHREDGVMVVHEGEEKLVHFGQCKQYLQDQVLTESTGDVAEVQLLM